MSNDLFASKGLKRKSMKCCVSSCEDPTNLEISYHSFPLDKALKDQWVEILRTQDVNEGMKVCGAHFNSEDFFPTLGEFKTHKLKVKRLKRTAVPSLLLPSPIPVSNGEDETPRPEFLTTADNIQPQSDAEKYSIGSYVCTSCGHLSNTESSFLEHLNAHVKLESHNKGAGADVSDEEPLSGFAVRVKVEKDIDDFLPEGDDGDAAGDADNSTDKVDSLLSHVAHPHDGDGRAVEDGEVEKSDSSCGDEEDPLSLPNENFELHERLVGASELPAMLSFLGNRSKKVSRTRLKWVMKRLLNKTYWDSHQRFVRYPPFSRQKLEQGDPVSWPSDRPRFKCVHCPFFTQTLRLFNAHFQTHADGWQFGCTTCQSCFDSEESLIAQHTSGSSSCGYIKIIDFNIRCEECWEFFKSQQELVYHVLFDFCVRKTKVACLVCNKEVIKVDIESHLEKHKSKSTD